jgi:hypothetical protein
MMDLSSQLPAALQGHVFVCLHFLYSQSWIHLRKPVRFLATRGSFLKTYASAKFKEIRSHPPPPLNFNQ